MTLFALLLFAAPSTEQVAQERFNAGDYEGALDHYLAWAKEPGVHVQDALWGAHESLHGLHKKTGEPDPLCRAHQLAQEVLARDDFQNESERAAWRELGDTDARDLEAASRRAGRPICEPPPAPEALLPVIARPPASPPRQETPRDRPSVALAPRGRGLLITGGVLLSAAAALGGVAIHSALQRDLFVETSRDIRDAASMQGYTDPMAASMWEELKHNVAAQLRMMLAASITSGIFGGVAVALIATGAHRRRAPSRFAARPMLAGLAFTARF
jgi:hypothetical protein